MPLNLILIKISKNVRRRFIIKVLVVGSGVREHAIIKNISKEAKIFNYGDCLNPGIKKLSLKYKIDPALSKRKIVDFAIKERIDIAIIEYENLLFDGVTNDLNRAGILTCNVTREASILEKNKVFTKNLMKEINPKMLPSSILVTSYAELMRKTEKVHGNLVLLDIKTGSRIILKKENISTMKKYFYGSKNGLLIEDWITGKEFSIYCFTDGKNYVFSCPIVNYPFLDETSLIKTGGMGSVGSGEKTLPFLKRKDYEHCCSIIKKVIKMMDKRDILYNGTLCGQFIITPSQDVFFIEADVRLGDTEITNFLVNLETSFLDLILSISNNNIKNLSLKMNKMKSITIAIVPPNYPYKIENVRYRIREDLIKKYGNELFFGKTYQKASSYLTTKSRTLAIMGRGNDYEDIRTKVMKSAEQFSPTLYFRQDVGIL